MHDTGHVMVYQIKNSPELPQIAFIFSWAGQKIRRLFSNRSRYARTRAYVKFVAALKGERAKKFTFSVTWNI